MGDFARRIVGVVRCHPSSSPLAFDRTLRGTRQPQQWTGPSPSAHSGVPSELTRQVKPLEPVCRVLGSPFSCIMTIVAFFTVLFTKQIPRGVFELMVPGLRWNLRGNAYAYFTTERYPPFVWG
jgi:hypothetical protein